MKNIGKTGENLVAEYFKQQGSLVKTSDDNFDSEKDLIVDGKNVEVKTQTIYRMFPYNGNRVHAFTVDIHKECDKIYSNQLSKCLNVDRLIFVARSSSFDKLVKIYEAPPLGKRYFSIIQNPRDRRYVAGFPIAEMKELVSITKPEIVKYFMEDSFEKSQGY
jgi:hypothetical protein